jgi:hypothetical protein
MPCGLLIVCPGGGHDDGKGRDGGDGHDGGGGGKGNSWGPWREEEAKAAEAKLLDQLLAELTRMNDKMDGLQRAQELRGRAIEEQINRIVNRDVKMQDAFRQLQETVETLTQTMNTMSVQPPPGLSSASSSSGSRAAPPPPPVQGRTSTLTGRAPHPMDEPCAASDLEGWSPYCECRVARCEACRIHHTRDHLRRCTMSVGRYQHQKAVRLCAFCYAEAYGAE